MSEKQENEKQTDEARESDSKDLSDESLEDIVGGAGRSLIELPEDTGYRDWKGTTRGNKSRSGSGK